MARCLYCNIEIGNENIEICDNCRKKIWGERYKEIFQNKTDQKIKKCIYCNKEINKYIEVCDECGRKVFGDVLFKLIVTKTEEEIKKGNLIF